MPMRRVATGLWTGERTRSCARGEARPCCAYHHTREGCRRAAGRIRMVADTLQPLKLLRDVRQFRGYTPLEADTVEAGMPLAREDQLALMCMDVQRSGMDGSTACRGSRPMSP